MATNTFVWRLEMGRQFCLGDRTEVLLVVNIVIYSDKAKTNIFPFRYPKKIG